MGVSSREAAAPLNDALIDSTIMPLPARVAAGSPGGRRPLFVCLLLTLLLSPSGHSTPQIPSTTTIWTVIFPASFFFARAQTTQNSLVTVRCGINTTALPSFAAVEAAVCTALITDCTRIHVEEYSFARSDALITIAPGVPPTEDLIQVFTARAAKARLLQYNIFSFEVVAPPATTIWQDIFGPYLIYVLFGAAFLMGCVAVCIAACIWRRLRQPGYLEQRLLADHHAPRGELNSRLRPSSAPHNGSAVEGPQVNRGRSLDGPSSPRLATVPTSPSADRYQPGMASPGAQRSESRPSFGNPGHLQALLTGSDTRRQVPDPPREGNHGGGVHEILERLSRMESSMTRMARSHDDAEVAAFRVEMRPAPPIEVPRSVSMPAAAAVVEPSKIRAEGGHDRDAGPASSNSQDPTMEHWWREGTDNAMLDDAHLSDKPPPYEGLPQAGCPGTAPSDAVCGLSGGYDVGFLSRARHWALPPYLPPLPREIANLVMVRESLLQGAGVFARRFIDADIILFPFVHPTCVADDRAVCFSDVELRLKYGRDWRDRLRFFVRHPDKDVVVVAEEPQRRGWGCLLNSCRGTILEANCRMVFPSGACTPWVVTTRVIPPLAELLLDYAYPAAEGAGALSPHFEGD